MASVSSPGIGSGLDVNSIVTQLMAIEKQPLTLLQQQASVTQSKLSIYGQLQSKMSALRDAASALGNKDTWGQSIGSSADPSSVGVATSSGTRTGSYQVMVNSLAAAQSNAMSASLASQDTALGEGTLRIELGSWASGTFVAKTPASSVDVAIGPGTKTLAEVRDAINNANAGVTASVLTDASGSRLVLRSSTTGESNGFRIGVTDADGNDSDTAGLSALAYDPDNAISTMTLGQNASDAHVTVDNLPITSSSNTLTGVLDGLTLTLAKKTTAPVQVNSAADNDAIKKQVDAFVTAYNDVNSFLLAQTKYDDSTKTAGALQGDSAAIGIRQQLRNTLGLTSGASSVFGRLSDVGFDVKQDGSISVNSTKLTNGLANLTEIAKLFSTSDPVTPANDGIATRLRKLTDSMLDFDGTLQSRTDGLQHRLDLNQHKQDDMEARNTRTEARLRAQYAALDTQMSQLTALSSYVTQQVANWNKSTG